MDQVESKRFFLNLRALPGTLATALANDRIERFIGVVYMPEPELSATTSPPPLGRQFDGYIWLDETRAVEPLSAAEIEALKQSHPFAP